MYRVRISFAFTLAVAAASWGSAAAASPADSTSTFTLPGRSPVRRSFIGPEYHSFYLNPPGWLKYSVVPDTSDLDYLYSGVSIDSMGVDGAFHLPLDYYIAERKDREQNLLWGGLGRQYTVGDRPDQVTRLLKRYTNITLPVNIPGFATIFGKPEISIGVTGAADVHLSVRSDYTNLTALSALGSRQTAPAFSQDLTVNVNAKIGDKLSFTADWNTLRTFDFENLLKLKYTGHEDDIIQSVEAGNVTLQTPSQLISGSQALFGLKVGTQFGPFYLTTLASQKKGETRHLTLSGQQGTIIKHAQDYSQYHYFLDSVYKQFYEDYYAGSVKHVPSAAAPYHVVECEVWVTTPDLTDKTTRIGVATKRLQSIGASQFYPPAGAPPAGSEVGLWKKLAPTQYTYNADIGIVHLNEGVVQLSSGNSTNAIAVAYRYAGPDGKGGTSDDLICGNGTLSTQTTNNPRDTIQLRLVRPRNLLPSDTSMWNLQLRSIFSLNAVNVKPAGVDISVTYYRGPGDSSASSNFRSGQSALPWITVVGLDKSDGNGGNPDGKFDALIDVTVDTLRGELIFPYLEPFSNRTFKRKFPQQAAYADSVGFPLAYDALPGSAPGNAGADLIHDKFLINMRVQGATSNVINLNAFNIAPGSVRVTMNGAPLQQGVDYAVDEFSGQVTLRNQQALQPGANVQVEYEQNDIFSAATKTLLGARGDYIFSKNVKMGFTLFDYSQKIFTDKVRLGEEPVNNLVAGLDGSATMSLPFISKALGVLPMFDSRTKSSLTLRGEIAYVMPSITGGNSNIAVDGNQGTALLDDFEGARFTIPLAGSYGFWHHSAPPARNVADDGTILWDESGTVTDDQKVTTKAKFSWYNILPSDVLTTEIWPRRSVGRPSETTTILNFTFDPHSRGIYNYRPALSNDPRTVWGGATRVIYNSPTDLTADNITEVEIWMKVIGGVPQTGKMFLDIGQVSEDIIPNGRLDTEDGINADFPNVNGILNPGEDVGLDGRTDQQEKEDHAADIAAFSGQYPDMVQDPAGDNWQYQSGSRDYRQINGVEGNSVSEFGRNPDTEDLNGNNTLDAGNNYYEYEINLDTTDANKQKIGAGTNGWTQIRIPLRQYKRLIGTPSLQNVQNVRVWFAGFDNAITIRLAQMDLVGSRWQRLVRDTTQTGDSSLAISFVNYEDNHGAPDFYDSPPGVTRARNPYITDHIVYENEQSLALKVTGIPDGDERLAVRYEAGVDLFSYKGLALFVHGAESPIPITFTDTTNYDGEFFVRFGLDTLNYYEYREPLKPKWDDVRIDFGALTSVKTLRDTRNPSQIFRIPAAGHPSGATFAVRGNPTVTRVQFFALGVANPSGKGTALLTTNAWIDELRLVGSVNTNDWAATASAALQMSDLAQVQLSGTQTNPDYHRVDTRFGDRVQHQSWNFAAQSGAEKILKFVPGLAVPIVYSHNEELHQPRFAQQTDVNIDAAQAQKHDDLIRRGFSEAQARDSANDILISSQTLKVTDAYSIQGAKIPLPTKFWAVDDTWNKLTYGFDYVNTNERSPVMEHRRTWQWTARVQYGVQIKPFLTVKPITWSNPVPLLGDYKDWKINFFPASLNAGLVFARGHVEEKDRGVAYPNPTIRTFVATRNAGFNWPLTEGGFLSPVLDYNVSVSSTLLPLELIDSLHERSFNEILKLLFFHDRVLNFGADNQVTQNVQLTLKPKVPHILSLEKFTDFNATYNTSYNWANALTQGDAGKNAGWNSRLVLGGTVKLKLLTDEWFGLSKGGAKSLTDTASLAEDIFKYGIKSPLFDYDNVNLTFTQLNSSKNQGLVGGTGINNFWRPSQRLSEGPNRMYELGLISYPDGDVTFQPSSKFPFFQFGTTPGRRAEFGNFTDNYKQDNAIELRTQRELWKGATIILNWKSQWVYNQNQSIVTDSLGIPTIQSSVVTLDVTRSYLTLPPVLFLSVFDNTASNVVGKYQRARGTIEADPTLDSAARNGRRNEALADAFEQGFEALSFWPRAIQTLLPRVNWTFRWEGLERLPFLEPFAQRVTVEHSYSSTYTRRYQSLPDGGFATQGQTISLNFSPLLSITMTMKDKVVGGNMTGTARYNTTTAWGSQGSAAGTITKDLTTEISLTATYTRTGLAFPLFGLNLKNDIEASFTFSSMSKSSKTFDINDFKPGGTPLDGTTTITAEPSVRYTISQRVNARLFYRLRRTIPDASGSKVPETSTIEAGIDIHVSISGGQ